MAENMRGRDLVLSPNEFAFVLDSTKGNINSVVGPYKVSLSDSDKMVRFDEINKEFVDVDYIDDAIQKFITAPENYYIQIKNPAKEGVYPTVATTNSLPSLEIGRKVNIVGPCSFALFPGQMTKVIPGHRMHSNQYLKARVYDADALNAAETDSIANKPEGGSEDQIKNSVETGIASVDEEVSKNPPEEKKESQKFVVGQILIIKGTDVPFYIPPTGIEVLPIGGVGNNYVRDALTLRKLEYCILEDESGKRTYVHGPAVVFPRPDQSFINNEKEGGIIYHAIELSEISGIYVKVIDDYVDPDGTEHKVGEELFITGKDTPIYFPREEHSIIDYDGQIVYHAVAIPKGEGRYILNRKTGDVKTVIGPEMLLINPLDEVFLQRILTKDQCELWYPGNREVLKFNGILNADDYEYSTDYSASPARLCKSVSTPSGFSRNTTFTPPHTVRLDNSKFEGAVSISVRTGYAVNVISKDGKREVVIGPKTILLDYDQTLEVLELSTGKPKTTDYLLREVYLRVENNKISDIINVETSDFVKADVKVSYSVNFLKDYSDKWFSIENYVKFLCDRERSILKSVVKQYTIEEFYSESSNIIRSALLGAWNIDNDGEEPVEVSLVFEENGMEITDVDVLSVRLEGFYGDMIDNAQEEIVRNSIKLTSETKSLAIKRELVKIKEEVLNIDKSLELAEIAKTRDVAIENHKTTVVLSEEKAKADKAAYDAEVAYCKGKSAITELTIARERIRDNYNLEIERQKANLRQVERRSQTHQITDILDKISPRMIAAMETNANTQIIEAITDNISPYALANNSSAMDVMNTVLRGMPIDTSLRNILETLKVPKENNKE